MEIKNDIKLKYKLTGEYSISYIDEEALLLPNNDQIANKAIMLNKTSKELIELLNEPKSISDLVNYIRLNYNVDVKKSSEDICKFINNMVRLSIITEVKVC